MKFSLVIVVALGVCWPGLCESLLSEEGITEQTDEIKIKVWPQANHLTSPRHGSIPVEINIDPGDLQGEGLTTWWSWWRRRTPPLVFLWSRLSCLSPPKMQYNLIIDYI